MKILIDNGHGVNTPGKCSPDKRILEYKWNREIAVRLESALKAKGYDVQRIVTEDIDIPLNTRARRVNDICARSGGAKNCVLVSIHINAGVEGTPGSVKDKYGSWKSSRGWTVFVAPNASANSKKLARMLYDEAAARGLKGNRAVPPERYWIGNFTIIAHTACPAVLTENLFQDNRQDVEYLLSETGKQTIVDLHVAALEKYVKTQMA